MAERTKKDINIGRFERRLGQYSIIRSVDPISNERLCISRLDGGGIDVFYSDGSEYAWDFQLDQNGTVVKVFRSPIPRLEFVTFAIHPIVPKIPVSREDGVLMLEEVMKSQQLRRNGRRE